MFIMNIQYMQRYLPLQFAFKLFETRAFPLLSSDPNAFAQVRRELINACLDIVQFLPVLPEQRTNIVGKGVPNVHHNACSRCCGQCLDNRPGLGAHLRMVSVFVGQFL